LVVAVVLVVAVMLVDRSVNVALNGGDDPGRKVGSGLGFEIEWTSGSGHGSAPAGKRRARASATGVGTIDRMSPPKRAISRTSRDATKLCVVADGRKTVWTPEIAWFICACCNSDSKSDTARNPLRMKSASTLRARSTTRLECTVTLTDS